MFENGRCFGCVRCGFPLYVPASAFIETLPEGENILVVLTDPGHETGIPASCPRCTGDNFTEIGVKEGAKL